MHANGIKDVAVFILIIALMATPWIMMIRGRRNAIRGRRAVADALSPVERL